MRIGALVITTCVALCEFTASAQTSAGLASELTAFMAAEQSQNGPAALTHALAIQKIAAAVEWPANAPKFKLDIEKPADASLTLASQIENALRANDTVRIKLYAGALPVVVLKELTPAGPGHFEEPPDTDESDALPDMHRVFRLYRLAPAAVAANDLYAAAHYASELMVAASHYPNLFTGDATYHANTVAGQVALQLNNVPAASAFLIAAGKTTGSPVLNSFGPGMLLASELLTHGEQPSVLQYLTDCETFWKGGTGALTRWAALIQQGKPPQFPSMKLQQ